MQPYDSTPDSGNHGDVMMMQTRVLKDTGILGNWTNTVPVKVSEITLFGPMLLWSVQCLQNAANNEMPSFLLCWFVLNCVQNMNLYVAVITVNFYVLISWVASYF